MLSSGVGRPWVGPLLERELELDAIDAVLEDAWGGNGGLLVFHGPAGIGKSSLVGVAAERGVERGYLVLSGRGGELERDSAFGVVRQLFTPFFSRLTRERERELLSGAAARAAPVLGLGTTDDGLGVVDTFAALHGVHCVILNLEAQGPLLLIVDDLQWADGFSQQAVEYLARRLVGSRVALVIGVRVPDPGAESAPVAVVLGDPAARVLQLSPLSTKAAGRVVLSKLGAGCDSQFLAACSEATNGNPYLLLELVAACRAEGIAPTMDSAELVRELGPASIARAVLIRLAVPVGDAQALAHAVAVLDTAPLALAAALAELAAPVAQRAADALVLADVLAPERPLRFIHPIVRKAILSELGIGEASLLQRRCGQLLLESGAAPESVAAHLQQTEPMGETWVVVALRDGARAALAGGAPAAAAGYLERALAEPAPVALHGELLSELGYARIVSCEFETGFRALQDALELLGTAESRAEILAFMALYVPALDAAIPGTVSSLGDESRSLALALESHRRFDEDFDAHLARLHAYRDLPGDSEGERAMLCAVAASEAYTAARPAEAVVARALRGLQGSSFVVDRARFPAGAIFEFDSPRWAWEALVMAGRPDLMLDAIDAAMTTGLRIGAPILVANLHRERAEAVLRTGDLRTAAAEWSSALDVLAAAPQSMMIDEHIRLWLAYAKAEQGLQTEARALIAATSVVCVENVFFLEARHIRGAALARLGDLEAAVDDLLAGGEQLERVGIHNPAYELPWRAEAAAALAALGRDDQARAVIAPTLAPAHRWGAPGPLGRVLHAAALAAPTPEQRLTGLAGAIDVLHGSIARLDLARAMIDYGAALRRAGRRLDASERLAEGLDIADRCGAEPLVLRAREELAGTGRRPRRARISGPESLTPSERRVAQRAAAGRTNSQICQELFLSPKTVEMHLGRTYRKLDIPGRDRLADALVP
jgi:DNA-binding CsgD family transcriptional regulator